MCVLGVWTGRELDGYMTCREVDIEPRDDCVDEVTSLCVELEGGGEGQLFGGDVVEIDGEDAAGVGDAGFHFDGVDEGFGEGAVFQGGEVEPVDVVPDWWKISTSLSTCASVYTHSRSSRLCNHHPRFLTYRS